MKRLSPGARTTVLALLALGAGGLGAGLVVAAGLHWYGTPVLCAKGVLCELSGYWNVGAARAVHQTGVRDPYSSFAVVWETPNRQHPPRLRYRPTGAGTWTTVAGQSVPGPANGVVASNVFVHRAVVEGLEPGSRYRYQVSWDARSHHREFSPTFAARTMSRHGPVKLAFVADVCLKNRPDGRSGPIDAIIDHVSMQNVDVVLGGGDYACALDDGRYATAEPAIQQFFDEWQRVFTTVPFIAQYGNHECCHGEDVAFWRPRLALSWASGATSDGRSFAFDLADAHLVGLYGTGAEASASPDHVRWLDETLAAARARGQQHLLVFQHGPLFGSGRTHPPRMAYRRQIVPVLERHQVDLHLSAHDMSYERTRPLTAGAEGAPQTGAAGKGRWPGVIYAKVSPAGRRASAIDNLPAKAPSYMAVVDDDHYFYAVVTLTPGMMELVTHGFDQSGSHRVVDRVTMDW